MRALVTGGAGFIGSAVCRRLVGDGATVLNLDKLTYAATSGATEAIAGRSNYAFAKVDIADEGKLRAAIGEFEPDIIFHLAAESHVDRSITGPGGFVQTNLVGSFQMLNEAKRYWETLPQHKAERFRFVQVSTDEVYGSLGAKELFTEQTPYAPRSPYAASKAGADHLALSWFHTFGLPVIVSNCSNNYGPYQFPEKLIPLTIINASLRRPLPIYGDGLNVRDWLHVDDHVDALLAIGARGVPGEKYNVGAVSERTNLEVVHAICALIDGFRPASAPRKDLITFVQDRPGHDRRYAIDPSKIERQLGWRQTTGFEAGLRTTVKWYLDNEAWWGPLRNAAAERQGLAR